MICICSFPLEITLFGYTIWDISNVSYIYYCLLLGAVADIRLVLNIIGLNV